MRTCKRKNNKKSRSRKAKKRTTRRTRGGGETLRILQDNVNFVRMIRFLVLGKAYLNKFLIELERLFIYHKGSESFTKLTEQMRPLLSIADKLEQKSFQFLRDLQTETDVSQYDKRQIAHKLEILEAFRVGGVIIPPANDINGAIEILERGFLCFETVGSHLDDIDPQIPDMGPGMDVKIGEWLGSLQDDVNVIVDTLELFANGGEFYIYLNDIAEHDAQVTQRKGMIYAAKQGDGYIRQTPVLQNVFDFLGYDNVDSPIIDVPDLDRTDRYSMDLRAEDEVDVDSPN